MVEVHWTAYVTVLTVPVLAAVGAVIAYRQWRTAQNKLKLDLFDKRMLVYQAARDALGYIGSHGKTSHEQQIEYLTGIQTAKWLFGPEVHSYLSETLWHKIVDLELHQSMVYDAPNDHPDRSKHIKLKAETLKWLIAQYSVLDKMCAKYMVLGH
ncbi:hypothetical protein STPYR_10195 [uncultured Stenotrophomonas sp.]|uniref:DUF4760 domain-containing protein n=1 Tax=uncultured Stenotrophomonas sp. TaxID=165438 RepID=A0A1Y5Q386_9GAMM|nr:hypothetical protein STPYR_10195 [uncultured Stenotrophomonas sp.]